MPQRRSSRSRAANDWGDAYRRDFSTYEAATEKLRSLVCDLLRKHAIEVVQVDARAKTVESLVGKIDRKRGKYAEPLTEITDLIGIRVIAYYLEDVQTVEYLLREEFEVDEQHSVQRGADLDPDRFAYVSDHLIVSLSASRKGLPEWDVFSGKRAEIQVRTATQHAWAAIEHKLSYKAAGDVPNDLKRRLFRLSALFELADDQFSAVRRATADLEASYAETLRGGDFDVPVDSASLDAYVGESSRVDDIAALISKIAGIAVRSPTEGDTKRLERDRADLLELLERLDVATIGELDKLLSDSNRIREVLRKMAKVYNDQTPPGLMAFIEDWLTQLVLVETSADQAMITQIYGRYQTEAVQAAQKRRRGS